jgi:DNA-binding LacI/PurR family transcriptional regulator
MIVSNIQNPFFLDVFCSLQDAAVRNGFSVLVEHTGYDPTRLSESLRSMMGRQLAGIAAMVSEMEREIVEDLASKQVPAVFLDVSPPEGATVRAIQVRYEVGMQRTIDYLYLLGHRRMAFVGHHASLAPLEARRKTFVSTMNVHAADAEFTTVESEDGPAGGRDAARRLLATSFRPTAIVCTNDFMAMGVLRELKERGLRVPRDVSVTGFDNILLSEYSSPALTTVNVPRAYIGRLCFDALATLEGRLKLAQTITIDPELVVRESTGAAAV